MHRDIKPLFNFEPLASELEIRGALLLFARAQRSFGVKQ
jgi:hypothetical protein